MGDFPNKDTQFKKGQSGNPLGINAGRKPKMITKINRILGEDRKPQMSRDDYKTLFRILCECTPAEIKKLLESNELDNYSLYIASSLREAMKKGNLFLHRELMETVLKDDDEKASGTIIVQLGFDVGDKYGDTTESVQDVTEQEEQNGDE